MKTNLWRIVVACLVGVVLLWWLMGDMFSGAHVDAGAVKRETIQQFVDEQAVTRLPETYAVTMPFPGRIEPIDLVERTEVRKGQVVARLVPADLDLAVVEAEATVGRLEAAIRENADTSVEQTGAKQAQQYVESMKSTVEAALARTESGKAAWDFAERHLARIQNLFKSRSASEEDLDRATLQKVRDSINYRQDQLVYAALRAMQLATNLLPLAISQYIDRKGLREPVLQKERAEAIARLEQVKLNRQRGTMTSPVDGVVLNRAVTSERFLAAGTVLLEIGRLEDLEVEADLLSLDVSNVRPGQPVKIYGPSIGPQPVWGTVHRIYPAGFTKISSLGVEQQRVKVIVRFRPEVGGTGILPVSVGSTGGTPVPPGRRMVAEARLGVNYRVRVQVITDEKPNALVVPRSALFRNPDRQWEVYVVRRGRACLQPVTVGIMNDDYADVTEGLQEGDLVIRTHESTLTDGQRVQAIVDH